MFSILLFKVHVIRPWSQSIEKRAIGRNLKSFTSNENYFIFIASCRFCSCVSNSQRQRGSQTFLLSFDFPVNCLLDTKRFGNETKKLLWSRRYQRHDRKLSSQIAVGKCLSLSSCRRLFVETLVRCLILFIFCLIAHNDTQSS